MRIICDVLIECATLIKKIFHFKLLCLYNSLKSVYTFKKFIHIQSIFWNCCAAMPLGDNMKQVKLNEEWAIFNICIYEKRKRERDLSRKHHNCLYFSWMRQLLQMYIYSNDFSLSEQEMLSMITNVVGDIKQSLQIR